MRQILLLPLAALLAMPVFSQTPADTTLTIRNIELQGTRFAGLSERGGMKILRVDNNLSSVTNTAADAFRQLPSVITDMEGAVTYRGSGNVGMLVDGVPYGLLEEYSGDVLIQLPALFFNQISLGAFLRLMRCRMVMWAYSIWCLVCMEREIPLYMLRLGRDGMSDITQERY